MGLGGSQISMEGSDKSFNCSTIQLQFEINLGFSVQVLGTNYI